jgi:hypothetical protein
MRERREPIRNPWYVFHGIVPRGRLFHKGTATAGISTHRRIRCLNGARGFPNSPGSTHWPGLNLIGRTKKRVRSQLRNSGLSRASPATSKRSAPKGVPRLEEFLICTNGNCRFLLSLREGNKVWSREELILSSCPECDHEWSSRCPFCVQILDVTWQSEIPSCAHCRRPLKPEMRAD